MNLPNGYCLQNGKYCLTRVIGQGGFGITYLGEWNTEVKGELGAVKTAVPICIKEYFFKDYCFRDKETYEVKVHSETGKILFNKFKEKQIKEAKILSEVHHPYIVNVLEVFEENNTAYIAMEHISGASLKSMLNDSHILPESNVLKYTSQIGQALEFVHQKNILHLDIKPNNILIDKHDNARLIDFGVSKRYDIEEQEACTTTLTLSKGFASIEQYDDEGTVNFSPCPDIYSLGATMYNLLTGVIPVESILRATKPLIEPSELNKLITPKTEKVILKAMQVNPTDRYQSVKEMMGELDIPSYPTVADRVNTTSHKINDLMPNRPEEDENTQVKIPLHNDDCTDDDATVLTSKQLAASIKHKKRKRKILLPLLILSFAGLACAVSYLIQEDNQKTEQTNSAWVADAATKQIEPVIPNDLQVQQETGSEEKFLMTESTNTPNEKNKPEKKETKTTSSEKIGNKTENPAIKTETNIKADNKKDKTQETYNETKANETNYTSFFSSGKLKMEKGLYADAKKELTRAKDIKVTEEVIRLLLICDEKIEEKNIADRKAMYDISMAFGNYTIVRKKQNGRYGAIDAKGMERIKCIYLSVGRSDNGRAFEREDRLYDIYNSNGVLVGKGLTTY